MQNYCGLANMYILANYKTPKVNLTKNPPIFWSKSIAAKSAMKQKFSGGGSIQAYRPKPLISKTYNNVLCVSILT